jgi:hypothetical protein
MSELPLAIRDVAPGPGFTRLEAIRADGWPDGVHTGGPWLSPDSKEVWKPLDGRPYVNAACHYPTRELEALCVMANQPGFPVNWRLAFAGSVTAAGRTYTRRWLVRPRCQIVEPIESIHTPPHVTLEDVLQIERGVRLFNARGWEVGDRLVAGIDPQLRPFVVDLSAACQVGGGFHADDENRALAWMKDVGYRRLALLRQKGRHLVSGFDFARRRGAQYWHGSVYASPHRLDADSAGIPGAVYIQKEDYPEGAAAFDYPTWVVAPEPLEGYQIEQHHLTWAWSPIEKGPPDPLAAAVLRQRQGAPA